MPPEPKPVLQRILASAKFSSRADSHEVAFNAMGSPCRISISAPKTAAAPLLQQLMGWVAEFEARYSRFIPTSLVSHINAQAGREWVAIDPETEQLLGLCHEAHFITRGAFDPTSLPLIRLWDWKASPPKVPGDAAVKDALAKVGWRKVQRAPGKVFLPEPGMALDLGGIGKEYAVDQVVQLAVEGGATSVLVDFGRDVRVHGPAPGGKPAWHIGLEDPTQAGKCWTGVAINNMAVATSGNYIRCFEVQGQRYGHILDVRTGRPVQNGCLAVSVIAPSCTLAGMLSTTALVLGLDEGLKQIDAAFQAAGCLLTERGKFMSRRFHEHAVGMKG